MATTAQAKAPSAFQTAKTDEFAGKWDDLDYDLGNLAAFDTHPVDEEALKKSKETYLQQVTRDNTQLLVRHLFELPVEKTEDGPEAQLPAATSKLPRMRPVPEQKPETRWEKFAREKGIQKKKKSRKVWDETDKEWKAPWGKNKANEKKDWVVEVKPGEDPYQDPFEKKALEKEQKVVQNKLNRVKNLQRNSKKESDKTPAGIPTQVSLEEGKVDGPTGQGKKQKGKPKGEALDTKEKRLRAAQVSTASIGKFDAQLPGEPARPKDPKKRKRMPVETSVDKEHARDSDILRKVLHGSGEGEGTEHAGVKSSGKARRKSKDKESSSSKEPVATPTGNAQAKKKQRRATAAATAKKSPKGKKGKS